LPASIVCDVVTETLSMCPGCLGLDYGDALSRSWRPGLSRHGMPTFGRRDSAWCSFHRKPFEARSVLRDVRELAARSKA